MATLRIDRTTFANEREVVKEERRMRVDNQPYGRLSEIIYEQAFTVHPYKYPTVGSMQDLEAASVEDVRDFYRTYYVPSNATLIVGDFDSAQAKQLIEQYLGRVPAADASRAARYPEGAAADRGNAGSRSSRHGRCLSSSSLTTSPTTATLIRIRCTSPRRCSLTVRARGSTGSWCTSSSLRLPRSAAGNLIEHPEPVLCGGDRPAEP